MRTILLAGGRGPAASVHSPAGGGADDDQIELVEVSLTRATLAVSDRRVEVPEVCGIRIAWPSREEVKS